MAAQTLLVFSFIVKSNFVMGKTVERILSANDNRRGCIIDEYEDSFCKGSYWIEKVKKEERYNILTNKFEIVQVPNISIIKFDINVSNETMIVFGNKSIAQNLITALGIASGNSIISDSYNVNLKKVVDKIIYDESIEVLRMKLNDIVIDKGILVSCNVYLSTQNEPKRLVEKYINNIVQLSFLSKTIGVNFTLNSLGKITINKNNDDNYDELINNIMDLIH